MTRSTPTAPSQLGLVNRVVPAAEVVDEALALADRIGENSPIAVRLSRQLVREAVELDEAAGWQRTNELAVEVFSSGDAIEGATAFAEKRPPVWKSTVARRSRTTGGVAARWAVLIVGVMLLQSDVAMERWRVEDLAEPGRRVGRHDPLLPKAPAARRRPPARAASPGTAPSTSNGWPGSASCSAQGLTLALIGRLLNGDIDATDVPLAAAVAAADAEAPEEFLDARPSWPSGRAFRCRCSKRSRAKGLLLPRVHDGAERYTDGRRRDRAAGSGAARARPPAARAARARARPQRRRRATSPSRRSRCSTSTCASRCGLADLPDDEKAEQLVAAFRMLLPTVTALVAHHFRRVLLAVAQEHLERVGEDTELAAVSAEAGRRLEQGIPS